MDFALETNGAYDELLSSAAWARDHGMVAIAVPDHYLDSVSADPQTPAFDTFIQLGGLARESADLELVMLVTPITFRHPAVLYKMAVTIDHMSGGRFALGLGAGWLEREHELFGLPFPSGPDRMDLLEEALAYLEAALGRSDGGFSGSHFSIEPVATAPRPIGDLRMIVGGRGLHRTPRLAGRFGNEFNIFPGPRDDMIARLGRFRAAARVAGRDPEMILLSSAGQVLAAPDRAGYEEKLEARAALVGIPAAAVEAHLAARNAPLGTFEDVAEQLAVLAEVGVTRFYFQWWSGFDTAGAADLLGYLRRELG